MTKGFKTYRARLQNSFTAGIPMKDINSFMQVFHDHIHQIMFINFFEVEWVVMENPVVAL